MTVLVIGRSPFSAPRALAWIGGFVAAGFALSVLYADAGVGLPCPFRVVTGWECPLCGGTRMGAALLHGDIVAAFAFNPLALVGLAVIAVLGLLWSVETLGGPAVRPPAQGVAAVRRIGFLCWLAIGLLGASIYTVLRNLG